MKLIYIVGIILILTIPTVTLGYPIQKTVSLPTNSYDYNFTKLQTGSFPDNASWIGFNVVNDSSSTSVGIRSTSSGNGLTISTFDYSGSSNSYLKLKIESNESFNLKVTFSWNYNNSLFYTGDQILFGNNGSQMLGFALGPDYNNKLHMSASQDYTIGSQPSPFVPYTLDVAGNESSDTIYTNIVQGWNQTMHLPYILSAANEYSGSGLNLTIGGGYSNLTLYNLYLSASDSGFQIPGANQGENYNVSNVSLSSKINISENSSLLPAVDWTDNSIIYFSNSTEPSLKSFNFYNSTYSKFLVFPTGTEGKASTSDSGSAFFLLSKSGRYSVTVVNFTTGNISTVPINGTFSSHAYLIPSGPSVYVLNSTGTGILLSETTNSYAEDSFYPPEKGLLLSGGLTETGLSVDILNETSSQVFVVEYLENGSTTVSYIYKAGLFGSSVPYLYENAPEPVTELEVNKSLGIPGGGIFYGNSTTPYITDKNLSYLPSSGNHLALSENGVVFLLSGSTLIGTQIPVNSRFVEFDRNLTHGISISNSSITLYYTEKNPFSGEGVSVSLQNESIVRGNASIGYSVNSSVKYTINATFGNLTLSPHGGFLNFSTENMKNGTYVLEIIVSNIAGYASTLKESISVDNYLPIIVLNPANNSKILVNSQIDAEIMGLSGTVTTTVYMDGIDSSVYNGDNFSVIVPDRIGNLTLSLTTVDQFGVSRSYEVFYQVFAIENLTESASVSPDAFLSTGNFNLSWTPVEFSLGYNVSITSSSESFSYSGIENYTAVKIPSGEYDLRIFTTLENSSVISIIQENFTVQDFSPQLKLNRTTGNYFSFTGNSENNSLSVEAYSNVTGTFWMNVTRNGINALTLSGNGTFFSGTLNNSFSSLRYNGNYAVNLTVQELSGRENSTSFSFSVNNTLPVAPLSEKTLYCNVSNPALPLISQRNVTYFYVNGKDHNESTLAPSSPVVQVRSLSTNITVYAVSTWGNINSSSVRIIYSDGVPEINLTVSNNVLIWNNTLRVNYSISDPVNLTTVSFKINNATLEVKAQKEGSVSYLIKRDGIYNITANAEDVCGNTNLSITSSVICEYFPEISSFTQEIGMFMGFTHLSSHISGNYLQSVNISWSIDGRTVSSETSTWLFLLPGTHNISLSASYHGTSRVVSKSVFTFGFVPEVISLLAIVIFIVRRNYSGSRDVGIAREFIIRNLGKRRSEILSVGAKEKINRKTLSTVMRRMVSEGIMKFMPDPDGNIYVLRTEENN